jgi:hypothetical protein
MKKRVVWGLSPTWTGKHEAALQALKDDLGTPGKGLYRRDPSLPTFVYSDSSQLGIKR